MYRRYAIVDEKMIRDVGGAKLYAHLKAQKPKRGKVTRMA